MTGMSSLIGYTRLQVLHFNASPFFTSSTLVLHTGQARISSSSLSTAIQRVYQTEPRRHLAEPRRERRRRAAQRRSRTWVLAALLTLSLIWATYAGVAILAGLLARYRPLRLFGVGVLGVLVVKVFLFDMQALRSGYRIASFAGVGLLLLAISVLYQRERRT